MSQNPSFAHRATVSLRKLSTTERQVLEFFQKNREEVLVASAAELARRIGTSDATVIRTARALGFSGLDALRRQLAKEVRVSLSPAARLTRTLGSVKSDAASALELSTNIHVQSLERLHEDIGPELFEAATRCLATARRVFIFGIGPSSALADYFAIQLRRFGFDAGSLTRTGVLLADDLHRLRKGDVVVILAYSRIYLELDALLRCANQLAAPIILLTDTLGASLEGRVELILPVARGNAEGFSTHTATLGLIEALLIGIASRRPTETVAQLKALNALRASIAGEAMELPIVKRREKSSRR